MLVSGRSRSPQPLSAQPLGLPSMPQWMATRGGNLSHSGMRTRKGTASSTSCGASLFRMSLSFISRGAPSRHETGEPGQRLIQHGGVERVMDELPAFFRDNEIG